MLFRPETLWSVVYSIIIWFWRRNTENSGIKIRHLTCHIILRHVLLLLGFDSSALAHRVQLSNASAWHVYNIATVRSSTSAIHSFFWRVVVTQRRKLTLAHKSQPERQFGVRVFEKIEIMLACSWKQQKCYRSEWYPSGTRCLARRGERKGRSMRNSFRAGAPINESRSGVKANFSPW